MPSYIINILILVVIFYNSTAHTVPCVENASVAGVGDCIKPKSEPVHSWDYLSFDNKKKWKDIRGHGGDRHDGPIKLFGWNLPKRYIYKNPNTQLNSEEIKFVPYRVFDRYYGYFTTFQSREEPGKRCNMFTNMEEMFFQYKDNGEIKTREYQDNNMRRYLRRFKNFTKKWEKKDGKIAEGKFSSRKLEAMGFHNMNPRRFAERMVRGGDRDDGYLKNKPRDIEDKPRGKSTCEVLGLCPCGHKNRCMALDTLSNIEAVTQIGSQEYRRTKNSSFPKTFKLDTYKKLDDGCYEIRKCDGNDDGDIKKTCKAYYEEEGENNSYYSEEVINSLCSKYKNECLWQIKCKNPPSKPMGDVEICHYDFQCGSGYCQRFSNDIIEVLEKDPESYSLSSKMGKLKNGLGVCMPMAKCIPQCVNEGKPLVSGSDYCCPGLVNLNGSCASLGNKLIPPPGFTVDESNAENCSYNVTYEAGSDLFCLGAEQWEIKQECESSYEKGVIYEHNPQGQTVAVNVCLVNGVKDGSISIENCFGGLWSEKLSVKLPYLYYTRLFEGLQWLWGMADSEGKDHNFGTYKKAKQTMELFFEKNSAIENGFYSAVDGIRNNLSQLSQTEGSASGVGAYDAMATLYENLIEVDNQRADLFYQISGSDSLPTSGNGVQNDYRIMSVDIDAALYPEGNGYEFKTTLANILKNINSKQGFRSGSGKDKHGKGRFNMAKGRKGGCLFGREIWEGKDKACMRNDGKKAKCYWSLSGDKRRRLSDGDCVKEGWRIDDIYGPFHGTQGKGGLLDGIYPKSIRSSYLDYPNNTNEVKNPYLDFIKKSILGARAYAAARRKEIGLDVAPITLGQLRSNILRDWRIWADQLVGVNGECQGPFRKRVPAVVTLEEGYFWHRQKAASSDGVITEGLSFEDYTKLFRSMNNDKKRDIYHEIIANILTDFLIGFHWHDVDDKKGTYRFFRDGENKREYNSTIRLVNASLWLSDFYAQNAIASRKTKMCLNARKESLEQSLTDENNQSQMIDYVSFMGDTETSYPEGCEGGDSSSGGVSGGGSTNAPGSSIGNIGAVENNMGLGNAPSNDNDFQGDDNSPLGQGESTNIDSVSGSMLTSDAEKISSSGDSTTGESSTADSSGAGTNAKSKGGSSSKKLKLSKDAQKTLNSKNLKNAFEKLSKPPSLQTIIGGTAGTGAQTAALTPMNFSNSSVGSSAKPKMSDEEEEAYGLLQALQAQNDSGGRGGDDLDFDDDDKLEDVSSGGGESGVDPALVKAMEKNLEKYKAKEGDNLWKKISKTYMREGLRRLVGKRRLRNKKLPSLQKK
jgi:hypothetical protein